MSEPSLLQALLAHNPTVRAALAAQVPALEIIDDWHALSLALSEGTEDRVGTMIREFLGNKSERLILAAILMKADFAARAVELAPDFWRAWGGLDRHNKLMILDLLEEDLNP